MASLFTHKLGIKSQRFHGNSAGIWYLYLYVGRVAVTSRLLRKCVGHLYVFLVCDCDGVTASPLSALEYGPPLQPAPPGQFWWGLAIHQHSGEREQWPRPSTPTHSRWGPESTSHSIPTALLCVCLWLLWRSVARWVWLPNQTAGATGGHSSAWPACSSQTHTAMDVANSHKEEKASFLQVWQAFADKYGWIFLIISTWQTIQVL